MSKFDDFKPGDRVNHPTRGDGVVQAIVPGRGYTAAEQDVNACMYVLFSDSPSPAIFDRPWFVHARVTLCRLGGAA